VDLILHPSSGGETDGGADPDPNPAARLHPRGESGDRGGPHGGEALRALTDQFPELKRHLFNEEGRLRSFVNLYLGDEDVRYLQGEETPIPDGQTLSIVPSIAGGRSPGS
jgi:molybdopterin synthase sulfur carrier subunit